MAEAFPEEQSTSELHPDERGISVLLLAYRWQFDTYGLSTINKSLVNNLRLVDPEGKTIKITCAVVEEQGKISYADERDASSWGVVLKGAKRPMSKKRHENPQLQWLDEQTGTYYLHLQDQKFDFIIGHAPCLANGCFNFKYIYEQTGYLPKTVLMFHGLPKGEDGDIDSDMVEAADIVFSVGQAVENELIQYIKAVDNKPAHKMYIPSYPLELFHIIREEIEETIMGTQNITMMSEQIKDLQVLGLDFPLAVNAAIGAAEHIRDFDGVRTKLTMLTTNEEDRNKWKSTSEKILKRENVERSGLSSHVETPTDITKLQSCLKKSTLFLLPLKSDSPLFGTEALSAIAAGVPVLVSRFSGLAHLLQKVADDEPVVHETKLQSTTGIWKDRILERLLRPGESQRKANRLREQLLLDTSIAQTHLDFINIILKETSVQLQIEIQSDSLISQQHLNAAIKFGVGEVDASDINKYVVAFLRKLLLQRKKQDENLMESYLNREIEKQWQEVLSHLEGTDRKLINIESGSFILTLVCPTRESELQLRDNTWKDETQKKMTDLLKLLGAEVAVKLQTPEPIEMHHKPDPFDINQRQKMKTAGSEKHSIGYETMTTVSDLDSEILQSDFKVEGWLSQQQESDITALGDKDQSIQLEKTWLLDHVNADPTYTQAANRFTISEFGAIGISCEEKPSLSVMYPDLNKTPLILSDDTIYRSATFVKVSSKEYLAASCEKDGCLYLWDIESKNHKKVFDPELPAGKSSKDMNIFKINDNTIGYGDATASPDGSRRVFILNMDNEELTLSSTQRLFTPNMIWDICYTEVDGGTPCLLLCIPRNQCIKAVEMIGGKTRWEVGKQQMGEKFMPFTICLDQNGFAYIADFGQRKIHLLSAADGVVIKCFDCRNYGFYNIFAVRFHDQHLYMEHKILKKDTSMWTYAITKFKPFKEM